MIKPALKKFLTGIVMLGASALSSQAQSAWSDDFTSTPGSRWSYFADTVMGGRSSGGVDFITKDGKSFARLSGNVTTENNGGFIQIRNNLSARPDENLSGLQINVRGNGQRYFIHLRTRGTRLPWQYYQASFVANADWQRIDIPFSSFKPSGGFLRSAPAPDRLTSVGIVAYGREHTANLDVTEIGFY